MTRSVFVGLALAIAVALVAPPPPRMKGTATASRRKRPRNQMTRRPQSCSGWCAPQPDHPVADGWRQKNMQLSGSA